VLKGLFHIILLIRTMAANYWTSSQRRNFTFTKPQLEAMRKKMDESEQALIEKYPLPDRRLMNIYFSIRKRPSRPRPLHKLT
jgi:hypothetical protein